jgi:hypothetical protein
LSDTISTRLVIQAFPQTVSVWRRLDALLAEAMLVPADRREQWLAELLPRDRMFSNVLRALFERPNSETEGYVRESTSAAKPADTDSPAEPEQPGTMLGPDRLIRKLGTGGMGTVPVLAPADSPAYRLRKLIYRHSLQVAAALATALALGVGGSMALWQAGVAGSEAARATRVKQFIASTFTRAAPREGVGGVVNAPDLLSAATGRLEKELSLETAVALICRSQRRSGTPSSQRHFWVAQRGPVLHRLTERRIAMVP